MSRNAALLLVGLCVAIAVLIAFPKIRSGLSTSNTTPIAPATSSGTPQNQAANATQPGNTATRPIDGSPATAVTTFSNPPISVPSVSLQVTTAAVGTVAATRPPGVISLLTNVAPISDLEEAKPIPVLEKNYAATTNRDDRLDIMMDIAESSTAEAVKALTRLFELETETDLKVDLLDSLLGIEGFKDEKLIMLTLGSRQGLPAEVRQSAIDGLIDLDDRRAIPVLNGLLNDPDEEIREGAKDALEMIQSQPAVPAK